MQTTAFRTVANSLPENGVIFLTLLISKRYIPYTDLREKNPISIIRPIKIIIESIWNHLDIYRL